MFISKLNNSFNKNHLYGKNNSVACLCILYCNVFRVSKLRSVSKNVGFNPLIGKKIVEDYFLIVS